MSRSWIRRAGLTALVSALVLSTPAAAAQRDTRDNLAVVDQETTADLLERADSVLEQVFSYDYRELAEREQSLTDVSTEDFLAEQDVLLGQVETEAPAQQATLTSTVVASAVDWLANDEADVLVFLDQKFVTGTTGRETTVAATFLASFELVDDEWLIDSVDAFEAR